IPRPPTSTLFPYTTLFRSARITNDRTFAHASSKCFAAFCSASLRTGRICNSWLHDFSCGVCACVGALQPNRSAQQCEAAHCPMRSEEHTSELQSLAYLVCR